MTADRSRTGASRRLPPACSWISARRPSGLYSRARRRGGPRRPFAGRTCTYGAKAQIGQGAVHRHAAARVRQHRHGLQRLGGRRDGAQPPAVPVPDQAGDVGAARPRRARADRHARSTTGPTGSRSSSGPRSAVVGLALVAVLFSPPINGARRWFGVGGLGIQPSELAKLAVDLLHRRRCSSGGWHRINELGYALLPIGIVDRRRSSR